MGRKRPPEHDYICIRCGCPSSPPGPDAKHIGGGQGMRACKSAPHVMLRSEFDAMIAADMAALRARRSPA